MHAYPQNGALSGALRKFPCKPLRMCMCRSWLFLGARGPKTDQILRAPNVRKGEQPKGERERLEVVVGEIASDSAGERS